MSEKNGTVKALDDMDVMAFAKRHFKDVSVDRLKKHEVAEGQMLYRLGNGQEDDVVHLMITSEGSYTAYAPDDSGAMKKFDTGIFKA